MIFEVVLKDQIRNLETDKRSIYLLKISCSNDKVIIKKLLIE